MKGSGIRPCPNRRATIEEVEAAEAVPPPGEPSACNGWSLSYQDLAVFSTVGRSVARGGAAALGSARLRGGHGPRGGLPPPVIASLIQDDAVLGCPSPRPGQLPGRAATSSIGAPTSPDYYLACLSTTSRAPSSSRSVMAPKPEGILACRPDQLGENSPGHLVPNGVENN